MNWVEIALPGQSQAVRFQALSEMLQEAGFENQFSALETSEVDFAGHLSETQKSATVIRVVGALGDQVPKLRNEIPALMMSLKTADTICFENKYWWPKNFLFEGLQQVLAQDLVQVDFSGSALVIGAKSEARAAVGALVKAGFNRFNLADENVELGESMIAEFTHSYFNVDFKFTPLNRVTQLPGVNAIAINALPLDINPTFVEDISYFNFLKPGGVWVDLSLLPLDSPLVSEARSVGAVVEPGLHVVSQTDLAWAESHCRVKLDLNKYRQLLRERLK